MTVRMSHRFGWGLLLLVGVGWAFYAEGQYAPQAGFVNVRDFGATGDGVTKDTAGVQKAIDYCAGAGGGTVFFGQGTYVCASLHLKSRVTLWLDAGATIKGSEVREEYDRYEKLGFENDSDHETSFFHHALIWGEDIEHIGIGGRGVVDSNWQRRGGPKPIALKRCRFVDVQGVQIINSPNYCISMIGCENVNIDGVTILNGYCDGIDPDCCRNVRISNCHIECLDDAIVLKSSFSLGQHLPTENVVVTNCVIATECSCFKMGTESGGDFKRVAVSNCVMKDLNGVPPIGGIALESVDGSNVDGITVSNITMVNVRAPIFIRLGNRGRDMDAPVAGTLKHIAINNVIATGALNPSTITGIPGHYAQDIILSNIQLSYKSGVPYLPPDESPPELVERYPDGNMFGPLPVYGLYCRHVDGLTLRDVELSFEDGFRRMTTVEEREITWVTDDGHPQPSEPARPGHAFICNDVRDLSIDGFRARPSTEDEPVLRFIDVQDALVRGCIAAQGSTTFLEVMGAETRGICLTANDLSRAKKDVSVGSDVPAGAVR